MATRLSKIPSHAPSLTTRGENGEPMKAEDMDVALLVLYGHILYSGNSFYPALNYYFRAYSLDPENPGILLPIALCYIHHALKRQADNRHYLIIQGLSFMSLYRKARCPDEGSPDTMKDIKKNAQEHLYSLSKLQEVEFNYGRVYHSLGLLHQAVPCYERALELGDQIEVLRRDQDSGSRKRKRDSLDGEENVDMNSQDDIIAENFSPEAAVALQNIYALSGNIAGAQKVTEKYLII